MLSSCNIKPQASIDIRQYKIYDNSQHQAPRSDIRTTSVSTLWNLDHVKQEKATDVCATLAVY